MNEKEILIRKLYKEYFLKIYKYFYYKTLSKENSEDLTSETFLKLAEAIKRNKPIENFKSYLFGIAKNVFTMFLRKKYSEKEIFANFEEEFFEILKIQEKGISNFLDTLILKYIYKLPEKQKEILTLRLVEKYSLKEICNILNKNMNYVKTTQKRGIKNLKKMIACTPLITKSV